MTSKENFICKDCEYNNICAHEPFCWQRFVDGYGQVEITCNNHNKKEDNNMLNVMRSVSMSSEVKDLQIGDRITTVFPKVNQKLVTATVMKATDKQIILFVDQSVAERCVTKENITKFEDTELCNWLNVDFFNMLTPELREHVNTIRLPYIKELFNWDELDDWDKKNIDFTNDSYLRKWELIDRKARMIVPFDQWWSYWCMNPIKDRSAADFAYVYYGGRANYASASYSCGVRPVLVLDKEPKKKEFDGELVNRIDNILFGKLADAVQFRDALICHVQKYGKLSIMELNDILKATSNFIDSNYGWKDSSGFSIKEDPSGEGYQISFSDPVRIKE